MISAAGEPIDTRLQELRVGDPRLDSRALDDLIRDLRSSVDAGEQVPWTVILDVVESDAQHPTAREALLRFVLTQGPDHAKHETVRRAKDWATKRVAGARDAGDREARRAWFQLVSACIRWLEARPDAVPREWRRDVTALLMTVVELRLFPTDAVPLLTRTLLAAGLDREQASGVAAGIINAYGTRASMLGSPLVDLLTARDLDRMRAAVREAPTSDPAAFPFGAATALADIGDPTAASVLTETATRFSRAAATQQQRDTALHLEWISGVLHKHAELARVQQSTDRLLEWAVNAPVGGANRAWAFERAYERGASPAQIRSALRLLVDRVKQEPGPAPAPASMRLMSEAWPVKAWAVRAAILDPEEFAEVPAPPDELR